MDETTPAASSALVSNESSPLLASKRSSPTSPRVGGEGEAFCAEGLQTEIGRTFRGSSAAFHEEPLTPAAEDERRCSPATSDTSAKEDHSCPLT